MCGYIILAKEPFPCNESRYYERNGSETRLGRSLHRSIHWRETEHERGSLSSNGLFTSIGCSSQEWPCCFLWLSLASLNATLVPILLSFHTCTMTQRWRLFYRTRRPLDRSSSPAFLIHLLQSKPQNSTVGLYLRFRTAAASGKPGCGVTKPKRSTRTRSALVSLQRRSREAAGCHFLERSRTNTCIY